MEKEKETKKRREIKYEATQSHKTKIQSKDKGMNAECAVFVNVTNDTQINGM